MEYAKQGSVIQLENKKDLYLILSNDFFNHSGLAVICPVVQEAFPDALHIALRAELPQHIALLEHLNTIDLKSRFFSHKASISFEEIQNISDAIQGIFDYYSYE